MCSKYLIKNLYLRTKLHIQKYYVIFKRKKMSKVKAKKLSLQFVPYLFIVVTILTAFGSNGGTWA